MANKQATPYIGWSLAAMNFRRMMSERAVAPISLLIVGEPGTGKRTMAEAWRAASGAMEFPIINLDYGLTEIPEQCIAISTRPVRTWIPELKPLNLENLHLIPNCELDGEPISESLLTRFAIKLLVPPLRQRRMDILAILHSYADQPPLRNCPSFINSLLIYRMFLDATWAGNLQTLTDCLKMAIMSARKSSGPKIIDEDDLMIIPSTEPFNHATQFVSPFRPVVFRGKTESEWPRSWECDGADVSLDRLPFVAVSILLDAFWKSLGL